MRGTSIVVALVAGTAVRLLLSSLPPFRSRRRARRHEQAAEREQHRAATPKRGCHPDVLKRLDRRAPIVAALQWCRHNRHNPHAECTFCLDVIRPSSAPLRVTPCAHVFHAACLEQWVVYTADACLDCNHYSLSDDGSIQSHVRHPSCPNCSADLRVIPRRLLKAVMLTSVARSLSLRDLSTAAEMYDAGLVYSAALPLSLHTPHTDPRPRSRYVRRHSTTSEPPPVSVSHQVSTSSQRERRSFPDHAVALVRPPALTSAEQRGCQRSTTPHGIQEQFSASQIALQASS